MHTEEEKATAYADACAQQGFNIGDLQYTSKGALAWACFKAGYNSALAAPPAPAVEYAILRDTEEGNAHDAAANYAAELVALADKLDMLAASAKSNKAGATSATDFLRLLVDSRAVLTTGIRTLAAGNAHDSPEAAPATIDWFKNPAVRAAAEEQVYMELSLSGAAHDQAICLWIHAYGAGYAAALAAVPIEGGAAGKEVSRG